MRVFVCRKAFGRTRKRSPPSCSSIASSPQRSSTRQVRHLGRRVVDRPVDRPDLRKRGQYLDQALAVEALADMGDELDERLACVSALADDEVAEVALGGRLVVGLEVLLAGPVLHRVSDRVAEVGCEPAALEPEHLVPTTGPVETEDGALVARGERVLHLVSVVEELFCRDDRLERRLGDPGDAAQRILDPRVFGGELGLVGEILEAAAAAGRDSGRTAPRPVAGRPRAPPS